MNLQKRKFHVATTFLALFLSFSILSLRSLSNPYKDCGESCFSSEIIRMEKEGDCYLYEVEVSFSGACSHELSHFNIDMGCGKISEAFNSAGWKMESNHKDPATGLGGLKVDDIRGFGKSNVFQSFTITFKFCSDDTCQVLPDCLNASVAYKAGQCVYYQELKTSCSTPIQVIPYPTVPSCNGADDGSIKLNITGGEKPYSISWSNGAMDSLLEKVSSGSYFFKVTDALGEQFSDSVLLEEPELINIFATQTDPSCDGIETGAITLQLSGGTAPYSFQWSNGSVGKDINNLGAGVYTVTVTDANGCNASDTYILQNKNNIAVNQFISQPTCGDTEFGSIELEVTGGNEPYEFLWSDGSITQHRYELTDGFYDVIISDQSGCELNRSYSIRTLSSLSASANITHTNCYNEPVGMIDLFVTGGTKPYSYEWSNGATKEDISDADAGKYSVLITDAKGCEITYSATINQMNLQVYAYVTQPTCSGAEDAGIDGMVFFGEAPYVYEWSNGADTEDIENIGAGEYTLTVTDAIGCTGSATAWVTDPRPIQVNYTVLPHGCEDNISYDISLSVHGGAGGYAYEWSNGETTKNVSGLDEGTYSITVTDLNGCSFVGEIIADGDPGTLDCEENEDPEDGPENPDDTDNGEEGNDNDGNEGDETEGSGDDDGTNEGNEDGGSDDNEEEGDDDLPGDGDNGDDPEDNCNECFNASPVEITKTGNLIEYSITVNHNGNCRFDLSHFTIALPECAEIIDYSNNLGSKMEKVSPDPTTGIFGIKVDDIPSFGKDTYFTSFNINITLKATGEECAQSLDCYLPEVAYKAATCVYYEQTNGDCSQLAEGFHHDVQVYPNPVSDIVTVKMNTADTGKHYKIDILNSQGKVIRSEEFEGAYRELSFDLTGFKSDLFFIKIAGEDGWQRIVRILKN